MLVLLTVVNPNSKKSPIKRFLVKFNLNDDDGFFRLKCIDGKGIYYKKSDTNKETLFYGEVNESSRYNLGWFAELCNAEYGKWDDLTAHLASNLDAAQLTEVNQLSFDPTAFPSETRCFTVIVEFQN